MDGGAGGHEVEGRVGVEVLGAGEDPAQVGPAVGAPGGLDHRRGGIEGDDLGETIRQGAGHVPGPASNVEGPVPARGQLA